jgi:hypothetical protein
MYFNTPKEELLKIKLDTESNLKELEDDKK